MLNIISLDVGWVKHDTNRSTECLWWNVGAELGSNNTRVTVCSGDSAPDYSDLGSLSLGWGLVDVGNSLWTNKRCVE